MPRAVVRIRPFYLDRVAIGLSGLCVLHCVATSVLVVAMSAGGGLLLDPLFHEIGLTLAIGIGAVALGRGILRHGHARPAWIGALGLGIMAGAMHLPHAGDDREAVWTIVGVCVLALGHHLNARGHSRCAGHAGGARRDGPLAVPGSLA